MSSEPGRTFRITMGEGVFEVIRRVIDEHPNFGMIEYVAGSENHSAEWVIIPSDSVDLAVALVTSGIPDVVDGEAGVWMNEETIYEKVAEFRREKES